MAGGIPVQLVPWLLLALLARWSARRSHGWTWARWLAAVPGRARRSPAARPGAHPGAAATGCGPPGWTSRRQPRRPGWLTPAGIAAALRAQSTWRQVAYHLLAGPRSPWRRSSPSGCGWPASLYATVYLYGRRCARTADPARHLPARPVNLAHLPAPGRRLPDRGGHRRPARRPLADRGVAALDARAGRALLGPSRAEELEHRVEQLTQTRAGVVDAADAERRRLERDLHDGTQQRLVSLAINLGMARAQAGTAEQAQPGDRRGARGGEGRTRRAARPDPRPAPGGPRGPRP